MVRPEEVRHVAALARLKLPEDRLEEVAGDLGRILEYVELLAEIEERPDAEGGAEEDQGSLSGPPRRRRADEPGEPLAREEALRGAPRRDAETFRVPPVLDGGPGA